MPDAIDAEQNPADDQPDNSEASAITEADDANPAEGEQKQKPEADKSAAQPQATKEPDWKKSYTELQRDHGRMGRELGDYKRKFAELEAKITQNQPKEKNDPFAEDPVLAKLPDAQKQMLSGAVNAVLKANGIDNLRDLKARLDSQETVQRQQSLAREVEELKREIGDERFETYKDQIANAYDRAGWPAIPVKDMYKMVAFDEVAKDVAERHKANKEQRAARVAAADTGKTNSKSSPPAELTPETIAKMDPREAWRAILKQESRRVQG